MMLFEGFVYVVLRALVRRTSGLGIMECFAIFGLGELGFGVSKVGNMVGTVMCGSRARRVGEGGFREFRNSGCVS